MVSLNDVLLAMSNIPVDDPIAEIWGRGLQGGYKIIEYTGVLPITINANGDALIDYRIYGADGGVGEVAENLFDYNATDANNGYVSSSYISADGEITSAVSWFVSEYIRIHDATNYYLKFDTGGFNDRGIVFYDSNQDYISGINYRYGIANLPFSTPSNASFVRMSVRTSTMRNTMLTEGSTTPTSYIPYGYKLPMTVQSANLIDASLSEQTIEIKPSTSYAVSRYLDTPGQSASDLRFGVYDENDVLLWSDYLGTWWGENIKVYDNAKYFKITIPNRYLNGVSLVEGMRPAGLSTKVPYPANYIPYQKITIPIYIGENQLDAGEYVSFSEQKIYKDVSGTLTSTDPPVPLPEIPTINGTTIIDYDGTPKPSQMYIKYKDKGVQ